MSLRSSRSRNSGICSISGDCLLLAGIRVERFARIITDSLDNTKTFRSTLSEQYPIAHSKEFWTLDKAERYGSAVTRPDVRSINIDDSACLRDGTDVQHSLVFRLDGGCVTENEDFGDKLAVYLWWLIVVFKQTNHAFAYVLSADLFQGKAGTLTCAAGGNTYSFPFDASDARRCEVAEPIGADQYSVASVYDTRFDDSRYYGTDEWDREGVVNVKFERGFSVVMAVVWNDVEEGANEIERLASYVGDLEHRADTLADELCGGVYTLLLVFDEDGDFPCTRRLENLGQLGDGLL